MPHPRNKLLELQAALDEGQHLSHTDMMKYKRLCSDAVWRDSVAKEYRLLESCIQPGFMRRKKKLSKLDILECIHSQIIYLEEKAIMNLKRIRNSNNDKDGRTGFNTERKAIHEWFLKVLERYRYLRTLPEAEKIHLLGDQNKGESGPLWPWAANSTKRRELAHELLCSTADHDYAADASDASRVLMKNSEMLVGSHEVEPKPSRINKKTSALQAKDIEKTPRKYVRRGRKKSAKENIENEEAVDNPAEHQSVKSTRRYVRRKACNGQNSLTSSKRKPFAALNTPSSSVYIAEEIHSSATKPKKRGRKPGSKNATSRGRKKTAVVPADFSRPAKRSRSACCKKLDFHLGQEENAAGTIEQLINLLSNEKEISSSTSSFDHSRNASIPPMSTNQEPRMCDEFQSWDNLGFGAGSPGGLEELIHDKASAGPPNNAELSQEQMWSKCNKQFECRSETQKIAESSIVLPSRNGFFEEELLSHDLKRSEASNKPTMSCTGHVGEVRAEVKELVNQDLPMLLSSNIGPPKFPGKFTSPFEGVRVKVENREADGNIFLENFVGNNVKSVQKEDNVDDILSIFSESISVPKTSSYDMHKNSTPSFWRKQFTPNLSNTPSKKVVLRNSQICSNLQVPETAKQHNSIAEKVDHMRVNRDWYKPLKIDPEQQSMNSLMTLGTTFKANSFSPISHSFKEPCNLAFDFSDSHLASQSSFQSDPMLTKIKEEPPDDFPDFSSSIADGLKESSEPFNALHSSQEGDGFPRGLDAFIDLTVFTSPVIKEEPTQSPLADSPSVRLNFPISNELTDFLDSIPPLYDVPSSPILGPALKEEDCLSFFSDDMFQQAAGGPSEVFSSGFISHLPFEELW